MQTLLNKSHENGLFTLLERLITLLVIGKSVWVSHEESEWGQVASLIGGHLGTKVLYGCHARTNSKLPIVAYLAGTPPHMWDRGIFNKYYGVSVERHCPVIQEIGEVSKEISKNIRLGSGLDSSDLEQLMGLRLEYLAKYKGL